MIQIIITFILMFILGIIGGIIGQKQSGVSKINFTEAIIVSFITSLVVSGLSYYAKFY